MAVTIELLGTGNNQRTYTLDKDTITIGRSPDNDVVIDSTQVSKFHCRLLVRGNEFELEDLDSKNGTRVNGQLITKTTLASGDQFILSYAVPPLRVSFASVVELKDLGFNEPAATPLQQEAPPTIVGQAMLDDAIREQIARNAAARSSRKQPTPPPTIPSSARLTTPPAELRGPETTPRPPVVSPIPNTYPKQNNYSNLLFIAGGVVIVICVLLFLIPH